MQPPRRPQYPQYSSQSGPNRYRLARFKSFAKPQVWLSLLGLIGLGMFAWQFSQRPEWRQAMLRGTPEKSTDTAQREADALRADVDTLPLLNADLNAGVTAGLLNPDSTKDQTVSDQMQAANQVGQNAAQRLNQLSLEALLGGGAASGTTAQRATNSLGTGTTEPGLLGMGLGPIGNAVNAPGLNAPSATGIAPFSLNSPGTSRLSQRPTPASNQLGNALNRYSPARPNPNAPFQVKPSEEPQVTPQPTPAITPLAGTTALKPLNPANPNNIATPIAGSNAINPALLARPQTPQNGLNSFTGLTTGAVPPVAPSPSTTIRTRTPRTVAVPTPTIRSGRSTPSFSVPNGSTPLPPGTSQSLPTFSSPAPVEDIPFTAPRSTPGQRIGGGQIGTFSNP